MLCLRHLESFLTPTHLTLFSHYFPFHLGMCFGWGVIERLNLNFCTFTPSGELLHMHFYLYTSRCKLILPGILRMSFTTHSLLWVIINVVFVRNKFILYQQINALCNQLVKWMNIARIYGSSVKALNLNPCREVFSCTWHWSCRLQCKTVHRLNRFVWK